MSGADRTAEHEIPPADRTAVREYVVGPFGVNVPYCQLLREGQLVPLTPKAFDTLVFLIRHRDHVVSKEELMAAVWPNSFVSEDALTQNISAIRRALGDDAGRQEFIATIPRRGYRFIAPVVERYAALDAETGLDASGRDNASPETDLAAPATVTTGQSGVATAPATAWTRAVDGRRLSYVLAVAAVLIAGAWVVNGPQGAGRFPASPGGLVRFTQDSPRGATLVSGGVLSPDGRQLAFVAQDEGTGETRVWVRSLDAAEPRALPGTEGASRPFWSPDGRRVGFFANSSLKRVGLSDDAPRTLTQVVGIRPPGASWSSSDLILFAGSNRSGLSMVPASGGEPRTVTTLDDAARDVAHRWPHFLPDGRHFLYSVFSADTARSGIYVGSLDSEERHVRLLDASVVSAVYAPPGYLLYVRGNLLMAHPFDPSTRRLLGEAVSIAGNVRPPGAFTGTVLSASADGLLTFGGDASPEGLLWVDRAGNRLEEIDLALVNVSFSPDGRQLIGNVGSTDPADPKGGGIWWLDLNQGVPTQVVEAGIGALWSADGSRIAYVVRQPGGQAALHVRSAKNAAEDVVLWETSQDILLDSWSSDQRYIVTGSTPGKRNLWLVPTTGDTKAKQYLSSPFNQIQGQVSPRGQTIAYASDESGVWEVYVDSFPTPGTKRRVSIEGGVQPQWSPSGSELFYIAPDRTLMRVDFPGGQAGRPQPLFSAPVLWPLTNNRSHYVVAPDGQRFVFSVSTSKPIVVLVNWTAGLG